MNQISRFSPFALWLLIAQVTLAQVPANMDWQPTRPASLQTLLDGAVQKTLADFSADGLNSNQIAATVIVLDDPAHPAEASYRGEEQMYPASVIKLFYLAAAHRWMEDKKIEDTPELRRAMKDMIVDSLNEATGYIVDVLTETTSGPELSPEAIQAWWTKRNAVNRYYESLGFTNINVNKKPWCEGPYGRETQANKLFTPKRNWLTTDATARLMAQIVTSNMVTPARCGEMMELLHRDAASENEQARQFTALALPEGTKLWSKAGWTSEARHDCAYFQLPNGHKLVLTVFTDGHANKKQIVPSVARHLLAVLSKSP